VLGTQSVVCCTALVDRPGLSLLAIKHFLRRSYTAVANNTSASELLLALFKSPNFLNKTVPVVFY